jgi:hypothetical protein
MIDFSEQESLDAVDELLSEILIDGHEIKRVEIKEAKFDSEVSVVMNLFPALWVLSGGFNNEKKEIIDIIVSVFGLERGGKDNDFGVELRSPLKEDSFNSEIVISRPENVQKFLAGVSDKIHEMRAQENVPQEIQPPSSFAQIARENMKWMLAYGRREKQKHGKQ